MSPVILDSNQIESPTTMPNPEDLIETLPARTRALREEVAKAIVGQERVVEDVLLGLYCGEHVLLTGVPGLAKTLLIRSLAEALDLDFKRIQFTPDLMPADITGTEIIQDDPVKGTRALKFMPGPVFTNLLLADEINRTPPKTQAAMLQTMQEREVTAGRETMPLPKPFHVFATQNPIEMEGTYQLPEAATDRFMLSVMIHYPEPSQEVDMVRRTTGTVRPALEKVMNADDLLAIQQLVRAVPVSDEVIRFAVDLVGSTRPDAAGATEQVKRFVRWGAGPRASQYLILGAKGRAAMIGKPCADVEDVRSVALLVLRHRILTNFKARSEGMDADRLLDGLVKAARI
ncbi:MAG: MoxR-like ATPase [Verrucomicrobia bacterium]|nr:MAG: MoxR-like ATPase [Verrucomicrobiota bacterium]